MAQRPGRICPNCGTTLAADQRFCTNCGAISEAQPSSPPPPYQYGQPQQQQQQPYPPQYQQGQQVPPPYAQAPQQDQVGNALGLLGLWYMLRYGRRGRYHQGRRQSSGCCGCLVALAIIALLVGGSLVAVERTNPSLVNTAINNIRSGNFSNVQSGNFSSQPPITTTQINGTVPYASVNITIVDAKQSQAFLDDSSTSTNGMVRLDIREQSGASGGVYSYGDAVRLILPDQTSVAPVGEQNVLGPDTNVTRTNWLDFPVSSKIKINQLTLRIGTDTQAQMDIPLTGNANLKQYQPITVSPNASTTYAGLTWTITSATASWSQGGKQADKNTLFVTLTLKVDNSTAQDFSRYWGDYIRLKSGDTTSSPAGSTNFPTGFPANSTGTTGNVTFSMPQGNNSYTLIFLGNQNIQVNQASVDFKVG